MVTITKLAGIWTLLIMVAARAADSTAIDVPEPASLSLLAVAAGTIVVLRRRR